MSIVSVKHNVTGRLLETRNNHTFIESMRYIQAVTWTIIVGFGIIGNMITFRVLTKPGALFRTSTNLYLSFLAIVDIAYLLSSPLVRVAVLLGKDIRKMHWTVCQLHSLIIYTLSMLSVWLIVAVSIDRMIWTILPFRAKKICTRITAAKIITALTCVVLSTNLHCIFTLDLMKYRNTYKCTSKTKSMGQAIVLLDFIVSGVIPIIVMAIANILIAWKLRKMRVVKKNRLGGSASKNHPDRKKAILFNIAKNANRKVSVQSKNLSFNVNSENIKDLSMLENKTFDEDQDGEYSNNEKVDGEFLVSQIESATFTGAVDCTQKFCVQRFCIKSRSQPKPQVALPSKNKTPNLMTMLFSIHIFFVCASVPLLAYDMLTYVRYFENVRLMYVLLTEFFVYTVWYLNFSVHFLLYCMTGPQFRAKALRLLQENQEKMWCCVCSKARTREQAVEVYNRNLQKKYRERSKQDTLENSKLKYNDAVCSQLKNNPSHIDTISSAHSK